MTVEVTLSSKNGFSAQKTRLDKADRYEKDTMGYLNVFEGKTMVATYHPGAWDSVRLLDDKVEKTAKKVSVPKKTAEKKKNPQKTTVTKPKIREGAHIRTSPARGEGRLTR